MRYKFGNAGSGSNVGSFDNTGSGSNAGSGSEILAMVQQNQAHGSHSSQTI